MAGRHRLIKRKNWTLRATLAATVALIAVVLIGIGPTQAEPVAPLAPAMAEATAAWEKAAKLIQDSAPTSAVAPTGADSKVTAAAIRKFSLDTCLKE